MERAVQQSGFYIDYLVPREYAGEHRSLDTLIDTGDVFLRDSAARDLVHELIALTGLVGFDHKLDVCELSLTAGLTDIAGVDRCGLSPTLSRRNPYRLRKLSVLSRQVHIR